MLLFLLQRFGRFTNLVVVKKAAGSPRMSGGTDLISLIANFNIEFSDPNCFSTGLRLYSEQVLGVTISHRVKAYERMIIMLNPVLSPSVGQAMAKGFGFIAIKHVGLLRLYNAFRNLVVRLCAIARMLKVSS